MMNDKLEQRAGCYKHLTGAPHPDGASEGRFMETQSINKNSPGKKERVGAEKTASYRGKEAKVFLFTVQQGFPKHPLGHDAVETTKNKSDSPCFP